jgi:glutathione S-transferase
MMTLYHNDMSVCAAKVRIALTEKKLSWEGVHLDLRAGEAQKPDYLKLNPNAVVPTLVHDGRTIIESTVICEYIDDEWPDHPLKPDNSWGRAQMRLWTKQLDESVHAAVAVLSSCIAFRHQWLARAPQDRAKWLAGIPQPDRRERSQSMIELGLDSPYFAPALRRFVKLFDDFEIALENAPWLAGQGFSLAEIGYAPYLARLRHLGIDILFDRRPRVAGWSQRVAGRPSVREGVDRWFNPKYLELFEERRPEARTVVAKLLG